MESWCVPSAQRCGIREGDEPRTIRRHSAKAFVLSFTEALWYESRSTKLKVLALSPGATQTEFFDVAGTSDAAGGARLQTPETVVAAAIRVLGTRNPPPSIAVGRGSRAFLAVAKLLTRRRLTMTIGSLTAPKGDRA